MTKGYERPELNGGDALTQDAVPSAAQSADDFRRVIAESADIEDLNYVVTNVLYARGSLPREVRRAAVKAIRSYQVILSVARDPDGVLASREVADARDSASPSGPSALPRDHFNPSSGG